MIGDKAPTFYVGIDRSGARTALSAEFDGAAIEHCDLLNALTRRNLDDLEPDDGGPAPPPGPSPPPAPTPRRVVA